jgi:hypothetical protein
MEARTAAASSVAFAAKTIAFASWTARPAADYLLDES